jgi:hypothetical protein
MPAPCPVREDDLCEARGSARRLAEAFMLPSMIKGYRPVSAAPLGTTRES